MRHVVTLRPLDALRAIDKAMELLKRFTEGDLEAFETLFRQFQGEVYRLALRIVRDPSAAEEIVVDAFWKAYQARARFDAEGSFIAWVKRIAANLAIDHLRRRKPQEVLPENLSQPAKLDPLLRKEMRHQIQSAFHQLPPKLQAAAILALVEDQPYAEIAETLGISTQAVKIRVFRAVRILRKTLTEIGVKP